MWHKKTKKKTWHLKRKSFINQMYLTNLFEFYIFFSKDAEHPFLRFRRRRRKCNIKTWRLSGSSNTLIWNYCIKKSIRIQLSLVTISLSRKSIYQWQLEIRLYAICLLVSISFIFIRRYDDHVLNPNPVQMIVLYV